MMATMEPADEDCEQEHRPSIETTPEIRVAVPRFILDSGQKLPLDHAKTRPKKPWKTMEESTYIKYHKIPEGSQGTGFEANLNFDKMPHKVCTVAREDYVDGFPCLPPSRMPQDR
jgi:hypothetical protein